MRKRNGILCCLLVLGLILAARSGHPDSPTQPETEDKQTAVSEPVAISEPVPEQEPEEQDNRQEEFYKLVGEEDVIIYAEHGWPNELLSDKSLFRINVTDVICKEKDIIEYLLKKQDKADQMDMINLDSSYERHAVLRDLTGISTGDLYVTFCKINLEIDRVWTYDDDKTLLLNPGLFSAAYYSEILGAYSGTKFDSNAALFFVDGRRLKELQFDEDENFHQIEVITVVHYDEYSSDYDEYNVMFNGTIVSNGKFNIRELNGG